MAYVIALIVVIVFSAIVVKIGSVALRMTGLDKDTASFQSLSAFSGTGFTTSETELVLKNRTRRKIVKVLMILGNAGLASGIGTLIFALGDQAGAQWTFTWGTFEQLAQNRLFGLMLVFVTVSVIYLLGVAPWFNRWLDGFIARRLQRIPGLAAVLDFEAILTLGQYGMGAIDVREGNPIAGRTLRDLGLTQHQILVLAVIRAEEHRNTPPADFAVEVGDLERMRSFAIRDETNASGVRRTVPAADSEPAPDPTDDGSDGSDLLEPRIVSRPSANLESHGPCVVQGSKVKEKMLDRPTLTLEL